MSIVASVNSVSPFEADEPISTGDSMILRTQIKFKFPINRTNQPNPQLTPPPANARLLFPNACSSGDINPLFDIVIMAANGERPNERSSSTRPRAYRAVLMFPKGMNSSWTAAAKSDSAETIHGALESLLNVLAMALERFEENLLRELTTPLASGGGVIDESLVRSKDKGWKFGRK
ncbi:hypothetical protein Q7P36_006775 [Cladosporium allicinum]